MRGRVIQRLCHGVVWIAAIGWIAHRICIAVYWREKYRIGRRFIALLIGFLHFRFLKRNKIKKRNDRMPSLEKQPDEVALIA